MYADHNSNFDDSSYQGHEAVDSADDSDEAVDPEFINLLEDIEGNEHENIDLYSVLGVDKSASAADLRMAYKRLSLLFHPDKHSISTPEDNEKITSSASDAVAAFGQIASAYAILSNPEQRAIYDSFGYKEFSLGLDLTDVLIRYLKEPPEDRSLIPIPSIYELSVAQSINAGISIKNSVSLAGQVTAHNGVGIGTFLAIWRHHCSRKSIFGPTTIDTEFSYGRAGRGLSTGIRARRNFGQRFHGSLGLSLASLYERSPKSSINLIPGISAGVNIQLLSHVHAHLELRCLMNPGISSELFFASADGEYNARISSKLNASGYASLSLILEKSVSWTWLNPPRGSGVIDKENVPQPDCEWADSDNCDLEQQRRSKGNISCTIGVNTTDIGEFTLGAQCQISAHSRISGQIRLSIQKGVTVKLSLLRGTQTYSFPFILSDRPDRVALGYGLIFPILAFSAIRMLVYEPYLSRQLKLAQKSRRAKLREELARKRREALSTQELMRRAASRSKRNEMSISGLVIDQAIYGCLSPTSDPTTLSDVGGPLAFDVTIPLQAMIEKSHLRLPPGRWCDIQGFYDPCVGLLENPRQLHLSYTFHNSSHEVTVNENQGLAIPMSKHKVEIP
ncbi:putative dnaj (hsp40) homolog, subfamily C, member [Schistosoma mansoni]|uniref:putative dnaj (hsp40) homolog, subfamily C, member n=1 Tax=Schistosoma mansoni TaxID=6183 RepID=UPI00022DCB3D|nr:putative dnaj (hsp40) homolog, subfamily C, member [Schistosoma mansoni]|eukprot:XP_018655016.1 putative dnaj (hsp40) homolog, subfamily C, member [Schistosoma mansoni]